MISVKHFPCSGRVTKRTSDSRCSATLPLGGLFLRCAKSLFFLTSTASRAISSTVQRRPLTDRACVATSSYGPINCLRGTFMTWKPICGRNGSIFILYVRSAGHHNGKSTGKGVMEIKCPASELSVEDLCLHRKNFFLTSCDGSLWLKTSHSYYTQLQMEMALTQCEWADFVVYTSGIKEDIFVQRVDFDEKLWMRCRNVLCYFFQTFVILELLTRRLKWSNTLLA